MLQLQVFGVSRYSKKQPVFLVAMAVYGKFICQKKGEKPDISVKLLSGGRPVQTATAVASSSSESSNSSASAATDNNAAGKANTFLPGVVSRVRNTSAYCEWA